jgi:ATP-dependent Clp protease ATP-binding subunit ClpC
VELTQEAKELLVEEGYDPAMGARPLRRAIQRLIEDPLADFVLGRRLPAGGTIVIDRKEGTQEVAISVIEPVDGGEPKEPAGVGQGPSEGGED